jgi:hypothetical protein
MALSKMQIGRAALPFLVELAHARDTAAELRGASIVAIGSLAAIDDAPATAELVRATRGGETRARGLACVALGRVLERDPKATRVEAARRPLVDALVQVAFGDKSADRPWALLGLGIALRDDPTSELRTSAVTRVRELVTKTSRPDLEAAGALALGLMRDGEGSSMLEARLDDRPSTAVSIALLQGIGMGGGNYLAGSVRTLALADSTLPAVRVEAARTLALLGDAGSADALVRQLPEARGSEETAALARALGKLRHERGILPLAALFDAAKGSEPVRHEATAALADLADRQPCAWWTAYSIDQDPQLRAPTLSALLPR